jgi:hypothetical protein
MKASEVLTCVSARRGWCAGVLHLRGDQRCLRMTINQKLFGSDQFPVETKEAKMDEMWLLIAPLAVLQLGLMIFALVDWMRRPQTRYLNRWAWLPIIVIFSIIGPTAYFFLGREEE